MVRFEVATISGVDAYVTTARSAADDLELENVCRSTGHYRRGETRQRLHTQEFEMLGEDGQWSLLVKL